MAEIKIPDIYIDGEKMNCDNPEEMKTLGDILTSLVDCCLSQIPPAMIVNVKIDGKSYDDLSLIDTGTPSDTIKNAEVKTMKLADVADNNLTYLSEYLGKIKMLIQTGKADTDNAVLNKLAAELNNALPTVATETTEMFPTANICKLCNALKNIWQQLYETSFAEGDYCGSSAECIPLIEQASGMLTNIKEETRKASDAGVMPAAYRNTLPGTIEAIEELLPRMSEVSQHLTAGHDKDAMQTVTDFTEILDNGLRFYSLLMQNGDSSRKTADIDEAFFGDIKGKLEELMQAMINKDSILIGDLMEYEFVPALEDLKNFLAKQMQ